jgi:ABC-type transport system substrate-binding protein
VTLIVANNKPERAQYAGIIADNMIKLGIDARVEYENFTTINDRVFSNSTGRPFNQGGYDIAFLGWTYGFPLPDCRLNFDGRPPNLPPTGDNYALYNSSELNNLLDQFYASTDLQTQISLVHEWQKIVYDDSPYAYIYEPTYLWPTNPKWTFWGGSKTYNPFVTFPDIQHFSGGKTYTVAVSYPFNEEPSPGWGVGGLNPAFTAASYESGSSWLIYWPITGSGAGTLDVDARDESYYPALATNIIHSADGLDWTVHIRKGALWQSGVEITSDDFVWTRWAIFNPKTASVNQAADIDNLGNVIAFTFLNGTTVTVDNRQSANEIIRHGWWRAVDKYTFEFHLSQPNPFAREEYAGFGIGPLLPKHIMEKFPPETWDDQPFSTASRPYTYTWDTMQYGGSGSYAAVGPVGDGPYYLETYNFTTNVATLKKFPQYWNATGLEALGQFTVDTYKVVLIRDRSAALQALGSGQVDWMFAYDFAGSDLPTLQSLGVNVIRAPGLEWQEMGFNMKHPVFGTGVDTPLGKGDPSRAAEAARDVRKAISHLIPRDQIVNDLFGGMGVPLASFLGPGWGVWYNKDLKPDSFDNKTAAALLRSAGYTVGGISGVTTVAQQGSLFWVVGGGVFAAIALTSTFLVTRRRRRTRSASLKTGFGNLDELLLNVDPQVPKQDRVLATVMFTDIVGSTERAAKVGDRGWQDLLNHHFGLVRKEVDRFSGREIGTTGDGMLAVFAGPERAVRCACSIRDAVRSLGLEIRVGLHTGEIQLTKMAGLDHVAGIAVHIGARVASQAQPGEILVSSTTKDLITGSGIQFKDYGMRALKGVPGEWHLFAVA